MSLEFPCPCCGKQLVVKASLAGKELTCPQCRVRIKAPKTAVAGSSRPPVDDAAADHHLLLMPSGNRLPENLIDMTAMVDIVFFILIFFMVTSIQALQAVMEFPSPQATGASATAEVAPDYANDPSYIRVTIDADDSIWVDDEQIFSAQDLRVKLRRLRDEDSQLRSLMVVGDPDASHGTLVLVLDAGADVGMEDLRFSVSQEPDALAG